MRPNAFGWVLAAAGLGLALPVQSQQTINLTIGSSHPENLPWVAAMKSHIVPEINSRLAAQGNRYKISWREAYGGVLYKANATLTSLQDGIADMGWVFTTLEAARMPLAQVSNYAPGVTDDYKLMSEIFNDLMQSVPPLGAEWDKYNVVFLGAMAADTLQLFTRFPVNGLTDLKGKKISAGGTIATWMQGTGMTPVDGALPTFYNDVKTGVSEGALTVSTGALGIKLYEAAPYVTRVNLGTFYAGALAINKDSLAKLPPEVQKVVREVGREYSAKNAELVTKGVEAAYRVFGTVGQSQSPPVKVADFPAAEREKWIRGMPNLAREWVTINEAKGLPAGRVLKTYMEAARSRGAKPVRDWDRE